MHGKTDDRRWQRRCLLWLAGILCCAAGCPLRAEILAGERYGPVHLELPPGSTRAYVVLFSDLQGWTVQDEAALRALAKAGAMAVGVDSQRYLSNIAGGQRPCDQLVGDAEALSRRLQRQFGHEAYWFPILSGVGGGGTIARVTLAQAPNNTFSGAVSLDPSGLLPGVRPLCAERPAIRAHAGQYRYGVSTALPGFWSVGLTPSASARTRTSVLLLRQGGTPMQIQSVTASVPDALVGLLGPYLNGEVAQGVRALPLVELPVNRPSDTMAVVLSGDGGWRDLDKVIAEDLQRDGVPVIGWDSVRYFWRRKTAQQTADDLSRTLRWYLARWHAQRIGLIGYSFGADVLPSVYALLPPDLKRRVVLVSLLGLTAEADWEIKVTGWLGASASAEATPTAPTQVPGPLIQCFYGADEQDSVCPALAGDGAQLIRSAGGHHFDHNYGAIESAIRQRLQPLPSR